MRRVDKAAVLLLTTVITAAAQEPLRRQRLENLADIWGQVYAFHPKLMAEEILARSFSDSDPQGRGC